MINIKMIARILGSLFFIEAGLLLLCSLLALYYQEPDVSAFFTSAAITAGAGIITSVFGKDAEKKISRRDGYVVVTFSWIFFSLFGMLPFYISGYIPHVTDAFFETMSGFTTTGASILDNIESLPHGFLFWRSMTQWIGGLGIVFFTIAVLPIFGVGGVQLFAAEATGPTHDKVHPRIGITAKGIWSIYLGLTIAEIVLLFAGGMDFFDSVCHSLTTTATGGYSTKQSSIAAFNSPYIEYVITAFMFLAGINFTLLFLFFLKGNFKRLFQDTEFHWYLGTVAFFTVFTTVTLIITSPMGIEESFRKAIFQVVSLQTTTGFVSADYMTWVPVLWTLMCIIMFFGACAGSTAGGMKCIRIAIMSRVVKNEFKHIIHPNAVLPVCINRQVISSTTRSAVLAFTFLYITIVFVGWLVLMIFGVGFEEAYSVVISSLGNVGPGIGKCGPAYSWSGLPDAAKWFSALLMLVGRLELFTVLLLFTPGFWKKH
ncbi:MAG: TrkH family potassium uptake protein [Bacteroides sp.]|nr:TrkH family potassium uptake protein [Bacteroides sp.]